MARTRNSSTSENPPEAACSFCSKPQTEVAHLISAEKRQAAICDECIGLCMSLIQMEDPDRLEQMINDATSHFPAPPPEPMTIEGLTEQMALARPPSHIWVNFDDLESLFSEGDKKRKLANLAKDFHCEIAEEDGGFLLTKHK